ncbi:MAG: hypothetical protein CMO80_18365 [Verrucomicrobiales bacterium]|nr:hypothetical protein [Verrucomicrobiales bacterium]
MVINGDSDESATLSGRICYWPGTEYPIRKRFIELGNPQWCAYIEAVSKRVVRDTDFAFPGEGSISK